MSTSKIGNHRLTPQEIRDRYEARKIKYKERNKEYRKKFYENNKGSMRYKFNSFINRSRSREIEVTITQDEFESLINSTCAYCGGNPTGLDRVCSNGNYTIDNVVPCCGDCNRMKFTHTLDKFKEHIKKIHDYLNL